MCARRFLIIIVILTLLAVAGAFALFQFGQQVLIKQATPKGHFVAPPADSGPDYSRIESWLDWPDPIHGTDATWVPSGFTPAKGEKATAAVFYIHPTTYLRTDRWNAPISDEESERRARLFVKTQASAFAAAGSVWVPRYRQAAFGAFLLDSADARQALDLAYSDIARAFDRFAARNPDGPIILAGHSQGALHLTRLLKERISSKPIARRIVAAYAVGWPVSVTADLPALGLPACVSADQTGCLLSWMSFGEPANPDLVLETYEDSAGLTGADRRREDMLCVNPLTGTRDGAAPPSSNPGTLVPTQDLGDATLAPGRVGARCDKGLLIVDGDIPPLGPYVLPGNNYHVYDYALFWAAIRQDAARRTAAWKP
jgi:hypothetical protein